MRNPNTRRPTTQGAIEIADPSIGAETSVSLEAVNPLRTVKKYVGDLDAEVAAKIIAAASDFALIVGHDGVIKDLALAKKKFLDFKIDKSIYVVDNRQRFYFKQLFKVELLHNNNKTPIKLQLASSSI